MDIFYFIYLFILFYLFFYRKQSKLLFDVTKTQK